MNANNNFFFSKSVCRAENLEGVRNAAVMVIYGTPKRKLCYCKGQSFIVVLIYGQSSCGEVE